MGFELDYIFHPRSVAVAGASASPDKRGHTYFKALLELGFRGKTYPVNNRASEILGVPAYPSVRDIPGEVDYVISSIPNRDILDLVDACAAKGVKVLHLFTARFSETGFSDAADLEQELLRRARAAGIRIIGPNCMGLHYPREGISFDTTFSREPGSVGILSQSGGNAMEIISDGGRRGLRFSKAVSYGNALDLNEADFIEYLLEDPETRAIGGYIEGVRDGRRLFEVLRRATARKPVVLLKGGRTSAGTGAVSSHTASLAGSQAVWDAFCRQTGVVPAADMEELLDLLVGFTFLPPGGGTHVLILGGGGGGSVRSADEAEEEGLHPVPVPQDARRELTAMHPFFGPWINNPMDTSILGGSGLRVYDLLEALARSPAYHLIMVNMGLGMGRDPQDPSARATRALDHNLDVSRHTGKPLALVMDDALPRGEGRWKAGQELREHAMAQGFAVFPTVRRAARALRRVTEYYLDRGVGEA